MRFVSRVVDAVEDPLRLDPDTVWMSPQVSLWGWGAAVTFQPGSGPDRLATIAEAFESFSAEVDVEGRERPVVFASTTFATGSTGSVGLVPRVMLGQRDGNWWTTTVAGAELPPGAPPAPPVDRARFAGSSVPDVRWLEAVAEATRRIGDGELDKVVLARDYGVWSREPFHPPRLLRHLRSRFPSCHVFRLANLVGASPELLVRRRGTEIESVVLAGTAPTYPDPTADAGAARELLDSDKDRWEHELSVRSVSETLEKMGIETETPDGPELMRLDNVHHLATPVTGHDRDRRHVLALAEALHPTAAVGGTPTEAAVGMIARLEGMDRGRYAAPVGWMGADGDGEVAIALRCAELSGARARLFAGAGIVAGSLPESELEETRVKLSAMMGALTETTEH